uniref:Uncharacterized protein n=1 Tax=Romanomermis culicivorax TaxID=13658 RepID=A0A915KSI4_ROMCU
MQAKIKDDGREYKYSKSLILIRMKPEKIVKHLGFGYPKTNLLGFGSDNLKLFGYPKFGFGHPLHLYRE